MAWVVLVWWLEHAIRITHGTIRVCCYWRGLAVSGCSSSPAVTVSVAGRRYSCDSASDLHTVMPPTVGRWGDDDGPVLRVVGRRRSSRRLRGRRAAPTTASPGRSSRCPAHVQSRTSVTLPGRQHGSATQAQRRPHQNIQVHQRGNPPPTPGTRLV